MWDVSAVTVLSTGLWRGSFLVHSHWPYIKWKSPDVFLPGAESVSEYRLRLWVSRYLEFLSKQGLQGLCRNLLVYSRWAHIKRKSPGVFPLWQESLGVFLPGAESVTEFRLRLWVSRYLEFVSKQGLWLKIVADALFLDAWEDVGRID